MHQRDSVASSLEHSKHAKAFASCKACGTMLLPGLTSKTTIESPGRSGKGPGQSKSRRVMPALIRDVTTQKSVRVECLICRRYTKTMLEAAKDGKNTLRQNAAGYVTKGPTNSLSSSTDAPKPSNPNIGSRQRAKARKKGSLSAMLEKSKETDSASPGIGLDLMDLMKQD
ncbi:MAG: hypothetical protein Q9217_006498 [Psora testacea]